MKTVIIDYGSGNLRSAEKSIVRAASELSFSADVRVTSAPDEVMKADRIILPGVGAFADCMNGLMSLDGMTEALTEAVLEKEKPFLGICVGMQLLADEGVEHGKCAGLGWIQGTVERIDIQEKSQLKIPHMGWNDLQINKENHPILKGIKNGDHVYFVHSFYFNLKDSGNCLATVNYGHDISAIIGRDNIVGTQFHPEKSQDVGLKILANFLQWKP